MHMHACTDNTELDAQVPAAVSRRLRQPQDRGRVPDGELQNFHLFRDEVHRRHRLPEPQGQSVSLR